MKNLFKIFLCSFLLVWATSATAEIKYGIGISAGQVETSGTETEGTAADTSNRSKTHPHQIHFELLSEQGIIGYFFIIFSIIFFLFKNIKVFINTSNINHLSNISYIIVFFLPVLPGAGIFSTFNGSIFWIIFSLCYLNYKTANTKKINQNHNL